MLTGLSAADRASLAAAADLAVGNALAGTTSGWKPGPPRTETDAVAAVVSVGLPDAARGWSPVLRPLGYRVQVTGVFCHQTPKVSFTDRRGVVRTCELADLLVVVDESIGGIPIDRRAVLVQAKLVPGGHKTLSGGDLVQLELYRNWPTFQFANAPFPNNRRDIGAAGSPGKVSESSDYGAIDLTPHVPSWVQALAGNPLSIAGGVSLGATLADMAAGLDGRETLVTAVDDWSDTIDELLTTTFAAAAGGYAGSPRRGVSTLAFAAGDEMSLGLGWVYGAGEGPPGDLIPGARGEGPISVVHVRMEQLESPTWLPSARSPAAGL